MDAGRRSASLQRRSTRGEHPRRPLCQQRFAENERITAVFDLETTEKTLRAMDIGRTAIDLAWEMKTTSVPDILEMLRDGYEEVDALTGKERDALPDTVRLAAVACSAWNYNNGSQDYAVEAMHHAESL